MLDFYLIQDNQNQSSRGLVLKPVGSIEDNLFFQLQTEGIIAPWFDYYSKFRWGSELVARMLQKLRLEAYTAGLTKERIAFMQMLQQAIDAGCGLMAIGE